MSVKLSPILREAHEAGLIDPFWGYHGSVERPGVPPFRAGSYVVPWRALSKRRGKHAQQYPTVSKSDRAYFVAGRFSEGLAGWRRDTNSFKRGRYWAPGDHLGRPVVLKVEPVGNVDFDWNMATAALAAVETPDSLSAELTADKLRIVEVFRGDALDHPVPPVSQDAKRRRVTSATLTSVRD